MNSSEEFEIVTSGWLHIRNSVLGRTFSNSVNTSHPKAFLSVPKRHINIMLGVHKRGSLYQPCVRERLFTWSSVACFAGPKTQESKRDNYKDRGLNFSPDQALLSLQDLCTACSRSNLGIACKEEGDESEKVKIKMFLSIHLEMWEGTIYLQSIIMVRVSLSLASWNGAAPQTNM